MYPVYSKIPAYGLDWRHGFAYDGISGRLLSFHRRFIEVKTHQMGWPRLRAYAESMGVVKSGDTDDQAIEAIEAALDAAIAIAAQAKTKTPAKVEASAKVA